MRFYCVELKVTDSQGKMHIPREWFIAPIDCIEIAIQLLISGEFIHYRYDGYTEQVVERD